MAKKNSKVVKMKDVKKSKPKKIKVANNSFEVFTPGSIFFNSVTKLKLQMSGKEMLDFMTFTKKITESAEFKAYQEMKNDIVKKFQEKQKKLPQKQRKAANYINMPELVKLMNMESSLEISKHKVAVADFPKWKDPEKIFNAHDAELLEGLFEFH